jgi:hypothetical protein
MVEALDRGARHREGIGLSAEPFTTLPERDLMPLLRQAQGGGQPGNTTADDGDTRAVTRQMNSDAITSVIVAISLIST